MKRTICHAVIGGLVGTVLITPLLGCGESAATSGSGPVEVAPALTDQIDAALKRAAGFLVERQSADGAWRSDVYAPFREGDALTPIVLLALQTLPRQNQPQQAIDRGLEFLQVLVGADGKVQPPRLGISYPVYMAAGAILAIGDRQDAASVRAREAWLAYLRDRQLTEANGWQPEDIFYGGWGYAPEIPRKLANPAELSPLAEPNISATVFALEALRAAGVESSASEIQQAKQFVLRCQNVAPEGSEPTAFDDGGFFFLQTDQFRNKAGVAGQDANGRERYSSYGSTTADGVRALLLCGDADDSPRVRAGFKWLADHFSADHQPGKFSVEAARDAVYFYYGRSAMRLITEFPQAADENSIDRKRWARELAAELLKRQRDNGSWVNADVEVREDDPVVATSMAMAALADCRRILNYTKREKRQSTDR